MYCSIATTLGYYIILNCIRPQEPTVKLSKTYCWKDNEIYLTFMLFNLVNIIITWAILQVYTYYNCTNYSTLVQWKLFIILSNSKHTYNAYKGYLMGEKNFKLFFATNQIQTWQNNFTHRKFRSKNVYLYIHKGKLKQQFNTP